MHVLSFNGVNQKRGKNKMAQKAFRWKRKNIPRIYSLRSTIT